MRKVCAEYYPISDCEVQIFVEDINTHLNEIDCDFVIFGNKMIDYARQEKSTTDYK